MANKEARARAKTSRTNPYYKAIIIQMKTHSINQYYSTI